MIASESTLLLLLETAGRKIGPTKHNEIFVLNYNADMILVWNVDDENVCTVENCIATCKSYRVVLAGLVFFLLGLVFDAVLFVCFRRIVRFPARSGEDVLVPLVPVAREHLSGVRFILLDAGVVD